MPPSYQRTGFLAACNSYARRYAKPPGTSRIPTSFGSLYLPRREPMLDLALFLGFALLCLYVAYERLCNRW